MGVSASKRHPAVVLGTWNFGNQVDQALADRMVGAFLDAGHVELDTAYEYWSGATEKILGRILTPTRREKIYLATKVNPWIEGGFTARGVTEQLETSLQRVNTDRFDLLYLHAPDLKTPVEVTLAACQELFRQGKVLELGLSNFAAWQVADAWRICKHNGWIAPTVYQGMYNAITRDVERELFPAIRSFGIRFRAYNPLAGGLLTGKYRSHRAAPKQGRFARPVYAERYWKESYFSAVEVIRSACTQGKLTIANGALRWIQHHSFLKGASGDGVIIGATSMEQQEANLEGLAGRRLSKRVAAAFDQAWQIARCDCPRYFRA